MQTFSGAKGPEQFATCLRTIVIRILRRLCVGAQDCNATSAFADDGLFCHFQARLISARDGEIGTRIGEHDGDFRAEAF
jgi:hypothetical protein